MIDLGELPCPDTTESNMHAQPHLHCGRLPHASRRRTTKYCFYGCSKIQVQSAGEKTTITEIINGDISAENTQFYATEGGIIQGPAIADLLDRSFEILRGGT